MTGDFQTLHSVQLNQSVILGPSGPSQTQQSLRPEQAACCWSPTQVRSCCLLMLPAPPSGRMPTPPPLLPALAVF